MSRSHTVLAAALIGVVVLAGGARLLRSDDQDALAAAVEVVSDAPVTVADDDDDAPVTVTVADDDDAPVTVADDDLLVDDAFPSGALADEVPQQQDPEPVGVPEPDCDLSIRLELGVTDPQVACLESRLIAAGALAGVDPDEEFDAITDVAVRTFQAANGLVVDGTVGPQTATLLGSWVGPAVLPPDPTTCPDTGRSAVIDRFNQRAWLCKAGQITELMPITSAISQPDPGTYQVYAKDMNASSTLTGAYSTMTHFVAFTYGKYEGARIAFHSIPRYSNGEYVQPLGSVGTQELFGDSSGCIRVLPDDAELIWNWLRIGDTVKVIT